MKKYFLSSMAGDIVFTFLIRFSGLNEIMYVWKVS